MQKLLSRPMIYETFQLLIGGKRARKYIIDQFVTPLVKDKYRILDIGCGTGYLLDYIPSSLEIEYLGYDFDEVYINYAKRRYGSRGTFVCDRVNNMNLSKGSRFSFIMAMGLLHHLDDYEASELCRLGEQHLQDSGRMIFLDGVYTKSQSRASKYFLSKDRGKFIRSEDEYLGIAGEHLKIDCAEVSDKLFRIPYTCMITVCGKK